MAQPFIVVRNYRADDEIKCQELIYDYIMSFASKSFFCICFREITLEFIIIVWAIMFIFFGVPLGLCALTIPACLFFLFSGTYFSFYSKAVQQMHQPKPTQSYVAECYEPFIFRCKPKETTYLIFMDEAPFEKTTRSTFRKKIIGVLSTKNHNSIYNAAWISRFAVAPGYSFQKVAEPMMNLLLNNCVTNGYGTVEGTVSEWQEDERDLFDSIGFTTRQIYHKQIIGQSLTVMKTQMTFDLRTNDALQKKN